jgi:hypothetical protein
MSIIPSRKLFHSKPQIIATSLNILSCVIWIMNIIISISGRL